MQRRKFLLSGASILAGRTLFGMDFPKRESVCELKSSLPKGVFKDFELTLDMRTKGGQAFLAFHTDADLKKGYKIAIQNDYSGMGWWRMTGSLLGVRNIVKNFAKDGEWFNLKLKVHGALIEVSVNGFKVVEYIEPEKPFRLPQNSKMCLSSGEFRLVGSFDGCVEIKNCKFKELAPRSDVKNQQWSAIDEADDPVIRLHQRDFPVFDSHVHLKGGLTFDWALARSRKIGINYGICPNCGKDFQLNRPEYVLDFLKEAKPQPFLIGMQAEGREWHQIFPYEIRDCFDYVFTDAMTFNDANGNRTHVWKPNEVKCPLGAEQEYMDWIVKTVCSVIKEPSDIYANPLWLPEILAKDYDKYWTAQRLSQVLESLVEAKKPMEINTTLDVPHFDFIEMAHKAGVKFTFATNNVNPEFSPFGVKTVDLAAGRFAKVLSVVEKFNLTCKDLYRPRRARV